MSLENVRVKCIRPKGYNDLKEWMLDSKNIYIGRSGIVFIDKQSYPKQNSPFYNPFKINKDTTREQAINKYRTYIVDKLEKDPKLLELLILMKGKNLGCWCHPEPCHGDVLLELIELYTKPKHTIDIQVKPNPKHTIDLQVKPNPTHTIDLQDKQNTKWVPYKYTKEDKEWRRTQSKLQSKKISEKQMCERHLGNIYTKGTNDNYIGCGKGWCCSPSSHSPLEMKMKITPKKKFIIKKPSPKPIQDQVVESKPTNDSLFPLDLKYQEFCKLLAETKLDQQDIDRRREYVYNTLIDYLGMEESQFIYEQSKIDLFFRMIDKNQKQFFSHLLNLYDLVFLENKLATYLCQNACSINICWNNRCTSTAGLCRLTKKSSKAHSMITIELSPHVFAEAIHKSQGLTLTNSGIPCSNILMCLMITFEHELIHGLINCFCIEYGTKNHGSPGIWKGKTSPTTAHSVTFMSITNNIFGHTKYTHNLLDYKYKVPKKTNSLFDPYTTLSIDYIATINDRGNIWKGRVLKTGGRNRKNAIVLNLINGNKYKVPYNLIVSYKDLDGKIHVR